MPLVRIDFPLVRLPNRAPSRVSRKFWSSCEHLIHYESADSPSHQVVIWVCLNHVDF
jgi:hypothetical protein